MTSPALVGPLSPGTPGYPDKLAKSLGIGAPGLWVHGALPVGSLAVAVVGSRAASGAARTQATSLSRDLAAVGVTVISGGAFGIDAAAHEGALAVGGTTVAVLGCGVDIIYPDRHAGLFARIVQQGGALVSHYPPGTPPRARQFPSRNRIVAAWADVVVVVEAADRSGALITARLARTLGIPVMAVPGSVGTDGLLDDGAGLVRDAASILAMARDPGARVSAPAAWPELPSGRLAGLIGALREGRLDPAGLAKHLNLPMPEVMSRIGEAEIEGLIRRRAGGEYEVTRVH